MQNSANMLVNEQKLIELLSNQNKIIRNEALSALERYFPKSPMVIKEILKVFHVYQKEDNLSLLSGIKSFLPTEDDLREILRILNEHIDQTDENSVNINFHLISALGRFPYDLIVSFKESFAFNEKLKKIYEIIINRQQIKSRPAAILWSELTEICKQNKRKEVDANTKQYLELLVEGLVEYGDQIKSKVIISLGRDISDDYFHICLVRLAGELKIRETIPYLFKTLMESDFMEIINDECTRALGKIGGREVVDQIELLYPDHQEIQPQFASILKNIPYDYSEDLAIRLLQSEQDLKQKTYLAETLCAMFSVKAFRLITKIIEHQEYDPSIVGLSDLLVPINEYHHLNCNLEPLQRKERQLFKMRMENDPLNRLLAAIDNVTQLSANKENNRKIGRNDPCPCGSGKKYKKCCLLKLQ